MVGRFVSCILFDKAPGVALYLNIITMRTLDSCIFNVTSQWRGLTA